MADSRCCFGCSNVRKGAWVIAIFDMLICILLTLKTLSMLNILSYPSYTYKKTLQPHSSFDDTLSTYSYERRPIPMENDFNVFNQLFVLFLFFYINLNLKKATYMHSVQSINQWLVTNSIFFVFFILYVGFITLRYSTPDIIPVGIPISIVVIYQIYVVKCFYDDEVKFMAVSDRNVGSQPILRNPPYVTITSQPVQSTPAYSIQTPSTYPIQSGPYVIQQVHQPVTPSPYPQQMHQCQPQQQTQTQHAHPQPEPYVPQEYCNPPPYSPSYNMPESSSVKQ